jgi:hypothetical protein
MTTDQKAARLLSPEELTWVGTPCEVCGLPLTASDVWTFGGTHGDCEAPGRVPAMLTLTLVMLPVLSF